MLEFEQWLNVNKDSIDTVSYQLFNDSLRCFKSDIDRPAYLLAYQGMMRQLKMIIINGQKPDGFTEGQWRDYIKGLNHDHSWDENTYDRIVQKAVKNEQDPSKDRPAVLCMADEIRNKFPFWREMRNVCAHYKEYNFIKAHTLVLYSFLCQYLLMITIEGGMESLVEDFRRHYDLSLTPENESIQPLIDKIPRMIKLEEFEPFIDRLRSIVGRWDHSDLNSILHSIYMTLGEPYKSQSMNYIHRNRSIENSYIDEYPESIILLLTDRSEIREFWYNRIFYTKKPLDILAQLIESKLVEGDETLESFDRLLSFYYADGKYFYDVKDSTIKSLKNAGFLKVFENKYFNLSHTKTFYKEICYKTNFFISLLQYETIDESFVNRTIEIFSERYPYTLAERFKNELLSEDSDFSKQFHKVLKSIGKELPSALTE